MAEVRECVSRACADPESPYEACLVESVVAYRAALDDLLNGMVPAVPADGTAWYVVWFLGAMCFDR
jgi:hypothetical protein